MRTRKLGNSNMDITPVGFGAWALGGGGWQFGWGPQDDNDSIAAIHRSLELGVNWIDTAAVYGLGHSEEVVARAVQQWKGPRPYVFTKCGMRWDKNGRVSKVRWIGVSNYDASQLQRCEKIAPVTSLQPPYSLIRRQIENEILPHCERRGIGVIVYSPMASGLLTGAMTRERIAKLPEDDWRKNSPELREPRLSKNLELVERLKKVAARYKTVPGAIAVAWALRVSAVTGAIVGARNAQQAEEVMRAGEIKLTPQDITEIEATAAAQVAR